MLDLLLTLQNKTGHQFICNGMPVCLPWESVGFDYLDSLGLKWYDEPPPMVIEFQEGVPSRDVFVRDNRAQWMFYWLCFGNWKRHGAYSRVLPSYEDPIDLLFRWNNTLDETVMSQMNSAYYLWRKRGVSWTHYR